MQLGDRWGLEPEPVSSNPFEADYYRTKIREFQVTLNALDNAYKAVVEARANPAISAADAYELDQAIAEFNAQKRSIKMTAEAINAGAALWNSVGGRMSVLNVPGTLGLAFVPPAAFLAAIAAAGGILLWASGWLQTTARVLEQIAIVSVADESQRADLIRNWQTVSNSLAESEASPLTSVASLVKWGAIAALGFLVYRAWQGSRK